VAKNSLLRPPTPRIIDVLYNMQSGAGAQSILTYVLQNAQFILNMVRSVKAIIEVFSSPAVLSVKNLLDTKATTIVNVLLDEDGFIRYLYAKITNNAPFDPESELALALVTAVKKAKGNPDV